MQQLGKKGKDSLTITARVIYSVYIYSNGYQMPLTSTLNKIDAVCPPVFMFQQRKENETNKIYVMSTEKVNLVGTGSEQSVIFLNRTNREELPECRHDKKDQI